MNIKRNPISACDMVFCFIITTLFKGGIVIASARLSIRPSVCYAISSLTIGRNSTKFGVRVTHMSGVCNSTFWPSPWGPGRVQRSTNIFEKSISMIFISNFLCVLTNKRYGIFIMSPRSYRRGGTWGCLGVKILFFSEHGHVAYQTEGDGEQNGIQVKCSH